MPYTVEDILEKVNVEDNLWLYSEPFTLADIPILIAALKRPECSKITHINLDSTGIDDTTVIALFKALSTAAGQLPNFPKLKMISLSENQIRSDGVIAIVEILQKKQLCLNELDLSSNRIDERGAAALAGAPISILNLARNPLNAKAYAALAKTTTLKELDLRKTIQVNLGEGDELGDNDPLPDPVEIEKLISAEADKGVAHFPHNTSLVNLRLSDNHLTAFSFQTLAGWQSPQLRELYLDGNQGGAAVTAFKTHPTLEVLNLENNGVPPLAAAELALNTQLRILYLRNNPIGDGNLAAEGLALNTTLTLLDLSNCNISTDGLTTLCTSQNTNLFRLELKNNKFGDAALPALTRFLTTHPNVAAVGLAENDLTDTHAQDLLKVTGLTSLDLDGNKLTENTANFFISFNTTLTMFSLNGKEVSAETNKKILAKRKINAADLWERQTSFNVFLYKYHVAQAKHTQEKPVVSFTQPLELSLFLLLLPKDIVCHIFTLLPFSCLQRTAPQIVQQFQFFGAKHEKLRLELRREGPKADAIMKPILLTYEQECRDKRQQLIPGPI